MHIQHIVNAASESAAQKNELTTREEEGAKLKRQLDKTESAVRNVSKSCPYTHTYTITFTFTFTYTFTYTYTYTYTTRCF